MQKKKNAMVHFKVNYWLQFGGQIEGQESKSDRGRGSSLGTVQLRDEVKFVEMRRQVNTNFGGKIDMDYQLSGVESGRE